jgi:hypothetical protein
MAPRVLMAHWRFSGFRGCVANHGCVAHRERRWLIGSEEIVAHWTYLAHEGRL